MKVFLVFYRFKCRRKLSTYTQRGSEEPLRFLISFDAVSALFTFKFLPCISCEVLHTTEVPSTASRWRLNGRHPSIISLHCFASSTEQPFPEVLLDMPDYYLLKGELHRHDSF